MAVTSAEMLKGMHNIVRAMGEKSINSDSYFEVAGYPEMGMLIKQFPWPTFSTAGEIEIASVAGTAMWQQQAPKINQQAPITFHETVNGSVQRFMKEVYKKGGYFEATVYEGVSPARFHRALKITKCFIQLDQVDRDWENRSQVTTFGGTLFYHFYGDEIPGNII
jgi:hypothetical protein